jgi:hypothetical protein
MIIIGYDTAHFNDYDYIFHNWNRFSAIRLFTELLDIKYFQLTDDNMK